MLAQLGGGGSGEVPRRAGRLEGVELRDVGAQQSLPTGTALVSTGAGHGRGLGPAHLHAAAADGGAGIVRPLAAVRVLRHLPPAVGAGGSTAHHEYRSMLGGGGKGCEVV